MKTNGVRQAVLNLTLKKAPFDLMECDRKKLEFRSGGNWIASRLLLKEYDFVKFTNGYGAQMPYFVCEYLGYVISKREFIKVYPGILKVQVHIGDYIILLGKIVERGNILKNG
jgi:hypothetical protein